MEGIFRDSDAFRVFSCDGERRCDLGGGGEVPEGIGEDGEVEGEFGGVFGFGEGGEIVDGVGLDPGYARAERLLGDVGLGLAEGRGTSY